ncbi:hypothetical protein ACKKBF_B02850 [Auxenochlorella protothecoides x Auxenochlorella symbiontica]
MLGRWAVQGTRSSRACTGRAFHCTPPTHDRIAVGISGGVDSAVAALLLQRAGHDVQGLFMRNWDEGEETGNRNCSVEADAAAAARVCRHLGVPLAEVDFVSEYWTRVFEGFLAQAGRGLTPNPDLACNRHIKFDLLAERAAALGCGALATGHYARLEPGDPPRLLCARDAARDQTYFLASVRPQALAYARFPLGGLTKPEVRALAAGAGLAEAAGRRSSAGICFVGRRRFGAFLEQYLAPLPGRYRDVDSGADLGPAANLLALTLGQRASVGGGPQRAYVAGKDVRARVAHVASGPDHPALRCRAALLRAPHWLDGGAAAAALAGGGELRCLYKARYGQEPLPCTLRALGRGGFRTSALCTLLEEDERIGPGFLVAHFDEPARAITPQQAFVMYDGERCLGSALIAKPGPSLAEEARGGCLDGARLAAADA